MESLDLVPYIQTLRKQARVLHREPDTRLAYHITNMSDESIVLSVQKPGYRAAGSIHVPTNTLNDAHNIARACFPRRAYNIVIPCPHPCHLVKNNFSLQSAHHAPTTVRAMQHASLTERTIHFFHDPVLTNLSARTTITDMLRTMKERFTHACAFMQEDTHINYHQTYLDSTHQLHPSFPNAIVHIIILADYSNPKNTNILLQLQTNDNNISLGEYSVPHQITLSMEHIQSFIQHSFAKTIKQQHIYNANDSMHQRLQYLRVLQEYSKHPPSTFIGKIQRCFNIFERHYRMQTTNN